MPTWNRPLGCIESTDPSLILSAGMITIGFPKFEPRRLVALWEILDTSEADGVREVATDQLTTDDIIVGAQINEAAFAALSRTGKILFVKAANGKQLSREEFIAEFKNDPLEVLAIQGQRKRMGASSA
jgi:hypothetical protein